jgi:hypothetical protein
MKVACSGLLLINRQPHSVPFWFPVGRDYVEELHGGDLDFKEVPALQEVALTIPSYYGRIWTSFSG